MIRLAALSISALCATSCNFAPLPRLNDDGGTSDGSGDAGPAAGAMLCTPTRSILGGTAKACVVQDSRGEFTASFDATIPTRHTLSVQLQECSPTCTRAQSLGAFATGHVVLVTPASPGVHGRFYKATYSIDTSGPPDSDFDSGVIVFP